jgi:hypothetical protein
MYIAARGINGSKKRKKAGLLIHPARKPRDPTLTGNHNHVSGEIIGPKALAVAPEAVAAGAADHLFDKI